MLRKLVRAAAQPVASLLFASNDARRALLWSAYRASFLKFQRDHADVECVPGDQYMDRYAFFPRLFEKLAVTDPIDYLEFGVFEGASIRWWSTHNTHRKSRFVGFDSFEGLPETVNDQWQKGRFSVDKATPAIDDPRVSFEVGWFNDTVPKFMARFTRSGRMVVNLDADIYSSTVLALTHVGPHLKSGDIVIFDEFADTIHEWRAYCDFQSMFNIPMRPVLQIRNWMTVAFEVM
jgi:O-methyltransferase